MPYGLSKCSTGSGLGFGVEGSGVGTRQRVLHQFDKNPVSPFRVDEDHPGPIRPPPRRVVKQGNPGPPELCYGLIQILDLKTDVMKALPPLFQELLERIS